MPARLRTALPAAVGLIVFIASLQVLRSALHTVSWHELARDVASVPPRRLALTAALTILNYAVLTAYDWIALAYINRPLPYRRVALTSVLAYAIASNVGWALLSGTSVRYRFYARWGIDGDDFARVVFSNAVTFWLGLLLLGGLTLAIGGSSVALLPAAGGLGAAVGWTLVIATFSYVIVAVAGNRAIRLGGLIFPLPPPRLALAQLAVSTIDWVLAGAVLYVLLPASSLSFAGFLGLFLTAQLLGLASHVPGGVGVFEGAMVLLLQRSITPGALLPALVVYRALYYLLPLVVALAVLVADELRIRKGQAARVSAAVGRISEQITPRVLAVFTFASGIVLLFSGATPAATERLALLNRVLPLGVIETSHFVGSLVGAALLLLAQGLVRRLDAAYFLTAAALSIGIAASLLKGADYEEATVLAVTLLALWRARPAFDRRAALFETRLTPGWIVAIAGAMAASIWLGLFAFKHVEYSKELWWQFELRGDASRFLRASVGSAVVLLLFAFAKLVGHAPHDVVTPTDADLGAADAAIDSQDATSPFLVYLRDKGVLFDDERRAFVMYGVQGRTWVALGDPVGPPERSAAVIRAFLERATDFGGTPVFYQVRKETLCRYADLGLTFVKLGEEATVDLREFTLAGGRAARFRQVMRRLQKEGASFRVVPRADVPQLIDRLQVISDDWLEAKRGSEKGFSLGFFDREYVSRFPVAVIEQQGRAVAFGNVWPGPNHVELSIDLMRYHRDAPRDVIEGLLVGVMQWAREQGYERFCLGMAPLSGFERSAVGPLWNRLGSFVYRHGELFYNFQGLRAYKEKFHPHWEPRYLVYPGGLRLPRILADISALVAGGYRRILLK